ncbi:MAG: BrnT family toxin [Deltaproteobacteria bacterium]|nr:BrnT family toxin [Deltaproteobacteria bacterium]
MHITWDPKKAETNLQKHRIRFSDAEMVLYDPFAMTMDEQVVKTEQRFVTVGADAIGRIIAVVYSYRGGPIRLISARKATPTERKQYEKGI